MKNDTSKTTTVRLLTSVYAEFKKNSYANEFNLQKLVNQSMKLYNDDEEYRNRMHEIMKSIEK